MFIQCIFINAKKSLININLWMFRVGGIYPLGFLSKCDTNINKNQTILDQKGFCISYLLSLSDIDKCKRVANDSSNVSFWDRILELVRDYIHYCRFNQWIVKTFIWIQLVYILRAVVRPSLLCFFLADRGVSSYFCLLWSGRVV